jgi:hypothetical protein
MKLIFTLLGLLVHLVMHAQVYGTTDDGKRVKLNSNNTWEYVQEKGTDTSAVALKNFTKPATATTLTKSAKNNFGFWYDKSKWRLANTGDKEDAEFSLDLMGGDAYAMFIAERVEIELDYLKEIALENAKGLDPETKLDLEENRIVNGKKIKFLQFSGQAKGMKFVYYGYYCSDESGTVQFVCFTSKSLLKDYQKDMLELLNGFVKVK